MKFENLIHQLRHKRLRRLMGRLVSPRVLIVSVPKSGTHLLWRTLSLFPQLRIGKVGQVRDTRRGQVIITHEPIRPVVSQAIEDLNFKVIFLIRDPRAVCLSFYHWVISDHENNGFLPYFAALLNDEARLAAVIKGMENKEEHPDPFFWAGINEEFRKRLPWINYPNCLTLTFEELVGPKGGGNSMVQEGKIWQLAKHLNLRLGQQDVQYVVDHLYGQTRTFRRGQINDWRSSFKPSHIELFKEETGELLVELGYERDVDW